MHLSNPLKSLHFTTFQFKSGIITRALYIIRKKPGEQIILKILVAMDSFKGSLTSLEAGTAVKNGILSVSAEHEVKVLPLADGGEGTLEALTDGLEGSYKTLTVTGPDGKKTDASYGIVEDDTAVIEMAEASGLPLVKNNDILTATSYGTGELIKDALDSGIRKFIIAIGGSATNDGGMGMLEALGVRFLDNNGKPVRRGASGLQALTNIDISCLDERIYKSAFKVACDVNNPLLGPSGCSYVYAPQKGATPEQVKDMDEWMSSYAKLSSEIIPEADPEFPGSGSAGGLGFALKYYLKAELVSGFKLVSDLIHLEEHINDSDLFITGEGRIDGQSLNGKGPVEAAKTAGRCGKKTILFAGSEGPDAIKLLSVVDSYHILPHVPDHMNRDVAIKNLEETVRRVFLSSY